VDVYRLVSEDTIEEKVVALQERKRHLFDSVIGEPPASAPHSPPTTSADCSSPTEFGVSRGSVAKNRLPSVRLRTSCTGAGPAPGARLRTCCTARCRGWGR